MAQLVRLVGESLSRLSLQALIHRLFSCICLPLWLFRLRFLFVFLLKAFVLRVVEHLTASLLLLALNHQLEVLLLLLLQFLAVGGFRSWLLIQIRTGPLFLVAALISPTPLVMTHALALRTLLPRDLHVRALLVCYKNPTTFYDTLKTVHLPVRLNWSRIPKVYKVVLVTILLSQSFSFLGLVAPLQREGFLLRHVDPGEIRERRLLRIKKSVAQDQLLVFQVERVVGELRPFRSFGAQAALYKPVFKEAQLAQEALPHFQVGAPRV